MGLPRPGKRQILKVQTFSVPLNGENNSHLLSDKALLIIGRNPIYHGYAPSRQSASESRDRDCTIKFLTMAKRSLLAPPVVH